MRPMSRNVTQRPVPTPARGAGRARTGLSTREASLQERSFHAGA